MLRVPSDLISGECTSQMGVKESVLLKNTFILRKVS